MDRKSRTSRSASLEDTNEELSLWKQICSSLTKLENIQKETESVLNSINKIHLAVNFDEGISLNLSQRLKDYYQSGIELSSSEASSDIILPGTSVAAKQPKQKDKNEEWILAVVINFQADKNKYHVEDVDQDEFGQKQRYLLPPRNVIPVPDGRDIRHAPEIGAGNDVLALYPGTTCFYKATVILPPSKHAKNKDITYQVQFEDDNNELKDVQREHVLEMPKSK
ncbi:hypothetical protein INT45_005101 [Circinella minor]|uniref:SGF29 C-terminal domain-containing protein n=1 Tax=Circinella minor TaxID=1195481 RepID=A0A8H7SBT3_9FUNG|nr:hypothetical protein INT45_005101 [Circinella minor]